MKIAKAALPLIAAMLFAIHTSPAQDQQPTPAQQAEMMKKFQESKTPGAEHKVLDPLAGEWNTTFEVGFPGVPKETGTASNKWMLGSLFLEMRHEGKLMGQPFQGLGYFGYDKMKKKYIGIWMDDMSSGVRVIEGDYNPSTKTITFMGKTDDAMTGRRNIDVKYIARIIDNNSYVFEYHNPELPADKSMQFRITYTRK